MSNPSLILARYAQAGKVVYGGAEPEGESLARTYKAERQRGLGVADAIAAAVDWLGRGHPAKWPKSGLASYQNAPSERGGRWIESPSAAGLRFVGWSDELRRLNHNGWFLYPDGDPGELARGCVYQLPARDGCPVYVEAIRLGEGGGRGRAWADQSGEDSAIVFMGARHVGERGGRDETDDCDALRDAAGGADSEAEFYAEQEREYQEAWRAGSDAAEALEEAKESREEARKLLRERLALRRALPRNAYPNACAALESSIRDALETAADKRRKAGELCERFPAWSRPTWADNYQAQYGRDPFPNGNPAIERLAEAFAEGFGQ